MKEDYSVSVISPVYNEEGNIAKVVQKIDDYLAAHAKFKNYQIIAVEDGSSDDSPAVLSRFSDKMSLLKIITRRRNFGYAQALVSGYKASAYPMVFYGCRCAVRNRRNREDGLLHMRF